MPIIDLLLPEFDQEMATTRKFLERVPEGRLGWKPHPKSWTTAALATHVANIPSWIAETMGKDELDYAPEGEAAYHVAEAKSPGELLERFDQNVAAGRAALAGAGDETLLRPWTLLATGKVLFTMPKVACLRSFVMNHIIHHRAQLGVYLRLVDVAVPGAYGPSADEGQM